MKRLMSVIRRLVCAVFGHKDVLESKHTTDNMGASQATICLYKCERCGQTSWLIVWEGTLGRVAIWDRALTADEIRALSED